jgi:hypothetical protein
MSGVMLLEMLVLMFRTWIKSLNDSIKSPESLLGTEYEKLVSGARERNMCGRPTGVPCENKTSGESLLCSRYSA